MKKMRLIAAMSLVGLGLSGLSGCGELPGGETNDTTKASISISVNGTAVEANGSVTVDELTPFTLKATVNNGDADDVVSWGSSTASAFTFSSSTGLETTATANYASSTPIQLFAQLQDDASVKTTVNVTINPAELTYKLSVDTSAMDLSYDLGDTFSSDGLVVILTGYAGETAQDPVEIGSDEYELSIADGTVLETAGQVEVTVTADEYEAQPAKFSITVEDNPLYPLQRNLAALEEENSLTNIEYSNGSQTPTYSSTVSSWNGFALNTDTHSLYQETADGLRKFTVNAGEGNSFSLTDAGYIYDSYDVSTLTAREMLDMDMATTADVFASLPLDGLKITESNDEVVVYDATGETYDAVLSLSGYSALEDNAMLFIQAELMTRYSLEVTISAFDDLSTVIEIDYTSDLNEIYSQILDMPTSLTAQIMLSTIGSSSLEVYLEGLVEDGDFEEKPAVSDTFKSVLDTIRGGKYFADFAYNGYTNTNAQYVGNDKYNGVIENFGKPESQTSDVITEIISAMNILVDTAGKSYKDQALTNSSLVFFESTQHVSNPNELTSFYPTEWQKVDDSFALSNENYRAYEESYQDLANGGMVWSPAGWNGFLKISNLEMDVSEYWDKVYESSGTALDPSDETGQSTVDYVSGSYNLYGSLSYKSGDETGILDQLTTLRSMSVYFDQYISALEEALGSQLYNSKVNIEYQLVDGDWSNPYSFITIQTYAGGMGEVNIGYVDQMDLYDFGSASNPTVDSFLELLTDTPTEPQA